MRKARRGPAPRLEALEGRELKTVGVALSQWKEVIITAPAASCNVTITRVDPPSKWGIGSIKVHWEQGALHGDSSFPDLGIKGINFAGDEGDDTVYNNTNLPSIMNGRGGNDTFFGGSGSDVLFGGAGDDHLYGGAGGDVVYGDAGSDHVYGGDGDDTVAGYHKNQNAAGFPFDTEPASDASCTDVIEGGWGKDYLLGADLGVNKMDGDGGDDWIVGGLHAVNAMNGGDGDDFLFGMGNINSMNGGRGLDYFQVFAASTLTVVDTGQDTDGDVVGLESGVNHNWVKITSQPEDVVYPDLYVSPRP